VSRVKSMPTRRARWENGRIRALCVTLGGSSVGRQRGCALASYAALAAPGRRPAAAGPWSTLSHLPVLDAPVRRSILLVEVGPPAFHLHAIFN
jgi:hypothetical protein